MYNLHEGIVCCWLLFQIEKGPPTDLFAFLEWHNSERRIRLFRELCHLCFGAWAHIFFSPSILPLLCASLKKIASSVFPAQAQKEKVRSKESGGDKLCLITFDTVELLEKCQRQRCYTGCMFSEGGKTNCKGAWESNKGIKLSLWMH